MREYPYYVAGAIPPKGAAFGAGLFAEHNLGKKMPEFARPEYILRCITNTSYDAPMPAKNPRITVTLEPADKALLERLSLLTGSSQGALVADILKESRPVFERLISVLEAAIEARENIAKSHAQGLEAAQLKLEEQLGITLEMFDSASRPILEEAEKVRRRTRRAAGSVASAEARPARSLTPLSNRGVRSTTRQAKKLSGARG